MVGAFVIVEEMAPGRNGGASTADPNLRVWGSLAQAWPKAEGSLFPGVTILGLAATAIRIRVERRALQRVFGDVMVVGFFIVQCLDGIFTYLGVTLLGPGIEANPLISAAMAAAGLTAGLAGAKLVAIAFGMGCTSGGCTVWSPCSPPPMSSSRFFPGRYCSRSSRQWSLGASVVGRSWALVIY